MSKLIKKRIHNIEKNLFNLKNNNTDETIINENLRKPKLFSRIKASFRKSKSIDIEPNVDKSKNENYQNSSKKSSKPIKRIFSCRTKSLPSNDISIPNISKGACLKSDSNDSITTIENNYPQLMVTNSGLINHGNTCYINSIIQCLNEASYFREYFIFKKYLEEIPMTNDELNSKNCMLKVISKLLTSLWIPSYDSDAISKEFKKVLANCDPTFYSNDQQDAQELLLFLLNHCHEFLKRKKPLKLSKSNWAEQTDLMRQQVTIESLNNSEIHSMFATYQQTIISCPNCHKKQNKLEPNFCLSLPIPADMMRPFLYCFVEKDGFQIVAGMWINTATSVGYIRQNVGHRFRVDPLTLVIMGVDENGFGKYYQDEDLAVDLLRESMKRKSHSPKKCHKFRRKSATKCGILNVLKKDMVSDDSIPESHYHDNEDEDEYNENDDGIEGVFADSSKYSLWDGVIVMELQVNVKLTPGSYRNSPNTNQNKPHSSSHDSSMSSSSTCSLHEMPNQTAESPHRFSGYYDNIPQSTKGNSKFINQSNQVHVNYHPTTPNNKSNFDNSAFYRENNRGQQYDASSLVHLLVIHVEEIDKNMQQPSSLTSVKGSNEYDWRRFSAPLSLLTSRETEFPDLYSVLINQLEEIYKCNIQSKLKLPLKFYVWDNLVDEKQEDSEITMTMQYPLLSEAVELAMPLLSSGRSQQHQSGVSNISVVRLVAVWSGRNAARLMQSVFGNLRATTHLSSAARTRKSECLSLQDAWPGGVQENGSVDNLRRDIKLNSASSGSAPGGSGTRLKVPRRRATNITLDDCLEAYTSDEVLDAKEAWCCPVCRTFQRATMCTRIYRPPEYLVLHLKRFQHQSFMHQSNTSLHPAGPQHVMGGNNNYHRVVVPATTTTTSCYNKSSEDNASSWNYEHTYTNNKLNVLVQYPITGLDISPFLSKDRCCNQVDNSEEDSSHLYDLYAVCNHQGTISTGHYTAFCLSCVDNKWRQYNDEQVTDLDLNKIVQSDAYILFYKKRCITNGNKHSGSVEPSVSSIMNKNANNNNNNEAIWSAAVHGEAEFHNGDDNDDDEIDAELGDSDSYERYMLKEYRSNNTRPRQSKTLPYSSMLVSNRNSKNNSYPIRTHHSVSRRSREMNGRPIKNGISSSNSYRIRNSKSNTISVPSRQYSPNHKYENGYHYGSAMRDSYNEMSRYHGNQSVHHVPHIYFN